MISSIFGPENEIHTTKPYINHAVKLNNMEIGKTFSCYADEVSVTQSAAPSKVNLAIPGMFFARAHAVRYSSTVRSDCSSLILPGIKSSSNSSRSFPRLTIDLIHQTSHTNPSSFSVTSLSETLRITCEHFPKEDLVGEVGQGARDTPFLEPKMPWESGIGNADGDTLPFLQSLHAGDYTVENNGVRTEFTPVTDTLCSERNTHNLFCEVNNQAPPKPKESREKVKQKSRIRADVDSVGSKDENQIVDEEDKTFSENSLIKDVIGKKITKYSKTKAIIHWLETKIKLNQLSHPYFSELANSHIQYPKCKLDESARQWLSDYPLSLGNGISKLSISSPPMYSTNVHGDYDGRDDEAGRGDKINFAMPRHTGRDAIQATSYECSNENFKTLNLASVVSSTRNLLKVTDRSTLTPANNIGVHEALHYQLTELNLVNTYPEEVNASLDSDAGPELCICKLCESLSTIGRTKRLARFWMPEDNMEYCTSSLSDTLVELIVLIRGVKSAACCRLPKITCTNSTKLFKCNVGTALKIRTAVKGSLLLEQLVQKFPYSCKNLPCFASQNLKKDENCSFPQEACGSRHGSSTDFLGVNVKETVITGRMPNLSECIVDLGLHGRLKAFSKTYEVGKDSKASSFVVGGKTCNESISCQEQEAIESICSSDAPLLSSFGRKSDFTRSRTKNEEDSVSSLKSSASFRCITPELNTDGQSIWSKNIQQNITTPFATPKQEFDLLKRTRVKRAQITGSCSGNSSASNDADQRVFLLLPGDGENGIPHVCMIEKNERDEREKLPETKQCVSTPCQTSLTCEIHNGNKLSPMYGPRSRSLSRSKEEQITLTPEETNKGSKDLGHRQESVFTSYDKTDLFSTGTSSYEDQYAGDLTLSSRKQSRPLTCVQEKKVKTFQMKNTQQESSTSISTDSEEDEDDEQLTCKNIKVRKLLKRFERLAKELLDTDRCSRSSVVNRKEGLKKTSSKDKAVNTINKALDEGDKKPTVLFESSWPKQTAQIEKVGEVPGTVCVLKNPTTISCESGACEHRAVTNEQEMARSNACTTSLARDPQILATYTYPGNTVMPPNPTVSLVSIPSCSSMNQTLSQVSAIQPPSTVLMQPVNRVLERTVTIQPEAESRTRNSDGSLRQKSRDISLSEESSSSSLQPKRHRSHKRDSHGRSSHDVHRKLKDGHRHHRRLHSERKIYLDHSTLKPRMDSQMNLMYYPWGNMQYPPGFLQSNFNPYFMGDGQLSQQNPIDPYRNPLYYPGSAPPQAYPLFPPPCPPQPCTCSASRGSMHLGYTPSNYTRQPSFDVYNAQSQYLSRCSGGSLSEMNPPRMCLENTRQSSVCSQNPSSAVYNRPSFRPGPREERSLPSGQDSDLHHPSSVWGATNPFITNTSRDPKAQQQVLKDPLTVPTTGIMDSRNHPAFQGRQIPRSPVPAPTTPQNSTYSKLGPWVGDEGASGTAPSTNQSHRNFIEDPRKHSELVRQAGLNTTQGVSAGCVEQNKQILGRGSSCESKQIQRVNSVLSTAPSAISLKSDRSKGPNTTVLPDGTIAIQGAGSTELVNRIKIRIPTSTTPGPRDSVQTDNHSSVMQEPNEYSHEPAALIARAGLPREPSTAEEWKLAESRFDQLLKARAAIESRLSHLPRENTASVHNVKTEEERIHERMDQIDREISALRLVLRKRCSQKRSLTKPK
ncbi:unnamed protein product [Calicophoron daubneyi]|uniref:Uncharacterized protein n=1 Tax=Calicophoron daubneyi TaxID=300641 RepID=A0AAV2TJK9_CALDB